MADESGRNQSALPNQTAQGPSGKIPKQIYLKPISELYSGYTS